jgi:hypothetical protein
MGELFCGVRPTYLMLLGAGRLECGEIVQGIVGVMEMKTRCCRGKETVRAGLKTLYSI